MKTYTTVQGDMWDSIAYKQLGDTAHTDKLMNANLRYAQGKRYRPDAVSPDTRRRRFYPGGDRAAGKAQTDGVGGILWQLSAVSGTLCSRYPRPP